MTITYTPLQILLALLLALAIAANVIVVARLARDLAARGKYAAVRATSTTAHPAVLGAASAGAIGASMEGVAADRAGTAPDFPQQGASEGLLVTFTRLSDLQLILFGFLHGLLTNLGLTYRRRYWGTVYDSVTKQPLDPAIVELVAAETDRVVDTAVTDMAGRFGFLIRPGSYYLRAQKTHYAFPSSLITGKVDGVFTNLYFGDHLTTKADAAVLSPNIPMDPQGVDWNQIDKQRIIKFHPRLEKFVPQSLQAVFWVGAAFALLRFIIQPTPLTLVLVGIYLFFAALRKLLPEARLWGRVISSSQPVAGLCLELSPAQLPSIVFNQSSTTADGKFFLKASPGKYILRVKRVAGRTASQIAQRKVTVGSSGVVNADVDIDRCGTQTSEAAPQAKRLNQANQHQHEGFTLIELLVVISIIGLLASVVLVSLNGARVKARDAKRTADIKQLATALEMYMNDNGTYPTEVSTCTNGWCCLGHGDAGTCWNGEYHGSTALDNVLVPKYLTKLPDDPLNKTSKFGDAYMYRNDSGVARLHWGIETCSPTADSCAGGTGGQWLSGAGIGCDYYCELYFR